MEIGFGECLNTTFEGTHTRHIDALLGEEKIAFSSFEDVDGMPDGLAHLIHKITFECVLPAGVEFYSTRFDSSNPSSFPRSCCPIILTGYVYSKIFALEIVPSMLSGMDSSVFSPSMAS
ncbi:hypothetical protein L1987_34990 [Smallanthus sonchifolius]|uniref:Uncharacterized protein n=1 Tax=Smallanthus sonchifolius TaxID=185202 RepID=A0ACB9HWV5_9ASTR|nr:hypothetical protein L1987_34990 [Smallanthus sonchifolius]